MTTYYTSEHEWIRIEGDIGTVGITAFAAEKLGDVVFVELPDIGRKVKKEGDMAVVESVKAASDVYAPVSGDITEANSAIVDDPAKVNADPEGSGWFVKLKLASKAELSGLMDKAAYDKFCAEQG
jgi:glycine cleavage system H protein